MNVRHLHFDLPSYLQALHGTSSTSTRRRGLVAGSWSQTQLNPHSLQHAIPVTNDSHLSLLGREREGSLAEQRLSLAYSKYHNLQGKKATPPANKHLIGTQALHLTK